MMTCLKKLLFCAATGIAIGVAALPISAHADDTIKFGVVEAKGDAGIAFMPVRFGGKYGVDIEMVEFKSSSTPVKALLSGDIDAYTTSPTIALTAISRGAPLRFIGCNWPGATYNLYSAPDIKTMADLKGKSLAVSGPGSVPYLFAREALVKGGLKSDEVTFANAGSGSDRFRALVAGVVDATATTTEFEPEAAKLGIHVLARARDVTPYMARNCVVTTEGMIATKRDLLVRFMAASMDGYSYALSHRDEAIALAREVARLADDDTGAAFIFDEAVANNAVDPLMAIPVDRLELTQDMLARHGTIEDQKDLKQFTDESIRQAALKIRKP